MSGDLLAFMVNLIHSKDMSLGRNFVVLNSAATLHGYVLENFNEITCQSQKKWRQTKATQPNATFSGHFGRVWLHGLGFCGFPFHMA